MLKAKQVMSKDVVTTASHQTLKDAYRIMRAFDIRHLPVVDSEEVVGMLSEGDVLLNSTPSGNDIEIPETRVSSAMSRNVISCFPDSSLTDVATTMMKFKIDSIPVVEDGRLCGIITTTDLLDVFCRERGGPRKREAAASDHIR